MLNIEFNPIQCTSQVFKNLTAQEGFLYFVTDTKQMFLGKDGKFIDMCGGINIVYGNKYIEYVDSGQTPDPNVPFVLADLEKKEYPLVNDLILNEDGCFYKVKTVSIEDDKIETTRLTLQGTGGGGGGGGTGGVGAANLRINHYGGQNRYFSAQSTKADLGIIAYSDDAANYISGIELAWDDTFASPFLTVSNLSHAMEKPLYVDIVKYLSNISSKGTRVYIRVTDKYGSTRYTYYIVTIASLQLAAEVGSLFVADTDIFEYSCAVGGTLELDSRTLKYELYSDDALMPIYSAEYELGSTTTGTVPYDLNLSAVGHGDYTLKVQMVGIINSVEIFSNELVHKVLRYRSEVGTAIFSMLLPEKIEQYTTFDISYLLAYGNTTKAYTVDILIDGDPVTSQSILAKTVYNYALSFDNQGSYLLKMVINELGVTVETVLEVTKYSGSLPVIETNHPSLRVYLTAKGRTNNAVDKDKWPDTKNVGQQALLNDFYFRSVNGWMTDEDGTDYLKVSQGASVTLPGYTPFDGNPKNKGLTIELDFMIDGVVDYDANFIECLSHYNNGKIQTGFVVKGDAFKYYASGTEMVSLNLVENKRIKLAFVIEAQNQKDANGKVIPFPMCRTYLNGIISSVFNYSNTDEFSNNAEDKAYLKIDSAGGQINIYNIRIYDIALDEQNILQNYQATIGSLADRQASYESNLIRDINGVIELEAIEAEKYNLQIPYVKIYGGYAADKKFKMAPKASNNKPALPIGKKDYRSIDIEIHYPKAHQNPYFTGYNDFAVTTTFEDSSLNVMTGFGQTPNKGAIMYAQGTSSLEYPVKNLRVKLLGDKFTVRPDIAPVELVTFKADFMESAGAHNTGAANFVDAAYESVGFATPGQKQFDGREDEVGTIVTCIKGHPCVIFWNPGIDEKGNILDKSPSNYHYIGKYNFNLDKATPEPFGFMEDEKDEKFGFEVDENDELVLDAKGNKKNSIFCYEFLDNNAKVCNFESDAQSQSLTHEDGTPYTEQEKYYDSWHSNRINEDKEVVPGWCIGFESRYPEDKTALEDGDALWPLASWLNDLYAIKYIDGDAETADRKFKAEYQKYLDKEFLLSYYLITEVLLMADSRVKNMMIATWGPEHRTWTDDDGNTQSHFGYIWYPIFYDMDTMLGLDNIGYVNKNYYDEDTVEDVYNGDEILWKFVRDCLKPELALLYNDYEQSSASTFTAPSIVPYFNDNQATMANETFYNEDAFYKYIDTFRTGYTNHLTGEAVLPGMSTRLYAAQGDRAMMREFFIENRIRYLRGKYESYNYQNGDRIEFRLTYPKEVVAQGDYILTEEDKKINASIKAVPPSGDFNFTSLKTGYAGVKVGVDSDNYRFVGEEEHTLKVDTKSGNGTETYLFGISNVADVGDLSDKYLYMLIVGAAQNNLKKLILGNHNEHYYNPYWGKDAITLTGFRFLEEFNLENCATFIGTVDFRDCPQIKKILLNGSNPRGVEFPIGGVIEELRIPDSLTTFCIDSHPTLTNEKFTIGYFDYTTNTYKNNFKNLAKVCFKNMPNIDTYSIAREALFSTPRNLQQYCFQDINWTLNKADDFEYSQSGRISGIRALDIMSNNLSHYIGDEDENGNFPGVATQAEALTGTITIALEGKAVNEYDIYNKYHDIYPDLKIVYAPGVSVEKASEIKFYNLETINESSEPYFTALSNKEQTLASLTTTLQSPAKPSTATESFTFAHKWKDQSKRMYLDTGAPYVRKEINSTSDIPVKPVEVPNESGKYYLYWLTNGDGMIEEYIVHEEAVTRVYSFELTIPTEDLLQLTPIFTTSERVYTVQFFTDEKTSLGSYYYKYKEKLYTNADAPIYYNKDDSMLEPHIRYAFVGWINEKDFENEVNDPIYIDEEQFEVTYDMKLFARCREEDCRNVPTDMKYFDIITENVTHPRTWYTGSGYMATTETVSDPISLGNMVCISVKPKYKKFLGNKITIPTYADPVTRTTPITAINSMSDMPQLTHVFFLEDSQCKTSIGLASGKGFNSCRNLKYIELPESFTHIGQGMFTFCNNLETVKFSSKTEYIGQNTFYSATKVQISKLPDTITYIADRAFYGSGSGITLTNLPLGMTQVNSQTFGGGVKKLKITTFGHTVGQELTALENNIKIIGPGAFENASGDTNISELYFKDSIEAIGASAFGGIFGPYGALITVYDDSRITHGTYTSNGQTYTIKSGVFGTNNVELDGYES
jgi:hypothetical protein